VWVLAPSCLGLTVAGSHGDVDSNVLARATVAR